jgi:hypothetical protein
LVEIHPTARRHGIEDPDIHHAVEQAMVIEDEDDDIRLDVGPSRSAAVLEVVTVRRAGLEELVIHAIPMRPKYRPLLPEADTDA